jgi:hypothetical protein
LRLPCNGSCFSLYSPGGNHTETTILHYCSSVVAMGPCLFVKLLLINGCCIFVYLTVVAQQQVCVPQYWRESLFILLLDIIRIVISRMMR